MLLFCGVLVLPYTTASTKPGSDQHLHLVFSEVEVLIDPIQFLLTSDLYCDFVFFPPLSKVYFHFFALPRLNSRNLLKSQLSHLKFLNKLVLLR